MARPNFPMMGNIPNMQQNLHNQYPQMPMNIPNQSMNMMPPQLGIPGKKYF